MKLLAAAASAIAMVAAASAAQAGVIYASPTGVDVNGVQTPDLTSVATRSVGISLNFDPTLKGNGGVLVDELGQTSPNTGWHDSQIEVYVDGSVTVSMWYYGNVALLHLGQAHFGENNTVSVTYDDATGTIRGDLNGAKTGYTSYPGVRQTPVQAGYAQYYSFGQGDSTNLYNGKDFTGSISDVVITNGAGSVPEPASWALMLLGVGLTGAAVRRKAAVAA